MLLIKTQQGVLVPLENVKFIKVNGKKVTAVLSIFYVPEEERTGTYELELGVYNSNSTANEVLGRIYKAVDYTHPNQVYTMPPK